mmetsp:Transcript_30030/g.93610  ORF Transcript_30030/g.93610 Transcript_30030/m.93610 type:complete len:331 (+) Transcript_30030:267-1259(+)
MHPGVVVEQQHLACLELHPASQPLAVGHLLQEVHGLPLRRRHLRARPGLSARGEAGFDVLPQDLAVLHGVQLASLAARQQRQALPELLLRPPLRHPIPLAVPRPAAAEAGVDVWALRRDGAVQGLRAEQLARAAHVGRPDAQHDQDVALPGAKAAGAVGVGVQLLGVGVPVAPVQPVWAVSRPRCDVANELPEVRALGHRAQAQRRAEDEQGATAERRLGRPREPPDERDAAAAQQLGAQGRASCRELALAAEPEALRRHGGLVHLEIEAAHGVHEAGEAVRSFAGEVHGLQPRWSLLSRPGLNSLILAARAASRLTVHSVRGLPEPAPS